MTLRVLGRYLAFQVPGWVIVGALLAAAIEWWQLPRLVASGLLALFVAKDLILFPFVRRAYEPGDGSHPRELVGQTASTTDDLAPSGYVRVSSELWRAELRGGGELPIGSRVRVVEVRGLTLLVDHAEEEVET